MKILCTTPTKIVKTFRYIIYKLRTPGSTTLPLVNKCTIKKKIDKEGCLVGLEFLFFHYRPQYIWFLDRP